MIGLNWGRRLRLKKQNKIYTQNTELLNSNSITGKYKYKKKCSEILS